MSGYFLSKLKGNDDFKTIFSEKEELENMINDNRIFCDLNLKEKTLIDFQDNPSYKLDEDSFFFIDYLKSSKRVQNKINRFINAIKSTGNFLNLKSNDLSKIEFLLYGNTLDENIILNIQTITPSFYVKSKRYLWGTIEGSKVQYKKEKNILFFKDVVDLHIDKNQHIILFKNFSNLKKLHEDFVEFYKEATKEEQRLFIGNINKYNLFMIYDNIELKPQNLKRLKYWLDKEIVGKIFGNRKKLETYLKKYEQYLSFSKESNKISISNNKDFTSLAKVMDECFYEGEITQNKKESNSSINLT